MSRGLADYRSQPVADPLDKKTVKSHTADGTQVVYDDATETIAIDRYKRTVAASSNPFGAISRAKLVPPSGLGVPLRKSGGDQ